MSLKKLRKQFLNLLDIHGVSGKEGRVRDYLRPILNSIMDTVTIDKYGNLLADKIYGDGEGATIMLSAHMDTVKGVLENREIIETEDGVIMSNKGPLGADDRAGIAIILTVLRNLNEVGFNGHVKVAFSREEEIGCVGAKNIDVNWYEDVDLAIIVDRRGSRDIVVGCGMAFCSNHVGDFMENVSRMADMEWKCVEGGISDAMIFAEEGINSINLSAGYENEHTNSEYVVLKDMKDTVKLILQSFAVVNNFYKGFGEVPSENNWVKSWWYGQGKDSQYYEDVFGDDIFLEQCDLNGDVYVYEAYNNIIVFEQGDNEIILSRESLRSIMSQLQSV